MTEKPLFAPITTSITVRISLVILVIETVLLGFMGTAYYHRFSREIDTSVKAKFHHTAELMSRLALNFDAVSEPGALGELIGEDVVDAFIVKNDGSIVYAMEKQREGDHYAKYLDRLEGYRLSDNAGGARFARFTLPGGESFVSSFAPLNVKGTRLGFLYVKIRGDDIERRKRSIVYLFLAGSMLTILLTTVIEALWVHRLFVPRIREAVSVLRRVEGADFAARVSTVGTPDQIGVLIGSVNSMISQVESHTRNLQGLAEAGEELAEAETVPDIYNTLLKIIEQRFPVVSNETCPCTSAGNGGRQGRSLFLSLGPMERKIVTGGEILLDGGKAAESCPEAPAGSRHARLFIPVLEEGKTVEVIALTIRLPGDQPPTGNDVFVRTLSRLMMNAVRRTEATGKLRLAENRYRDLFAGAVEGIFTTTVEGRPVTVNPALADMLGYDSPSEMLATVENLAAQVYVNGKDRETLLAGIRSDDIVRDFQIMCRRKNGEVFFASLWVRGTYDSKGNLAGLSGSMLDITERKQAEAEAEKRRAAEAAHKATSEILTVLEVKNNALQKALDDLQKTQARLVQSEKMALIGTMAGGVAHDLNNILAGVLSYPDLLLMQLPPDSSLRESLEAIRESGAKAAAVVSDLLTMSRSAAYSTVVFDINSLVERYLSSPAFREFSSRHPAVPVRMCLADDLRYTNCSPVHIEKVVMNLVQNALEAAGTTGAVVVQTENVDVKAGDSLSESLSPGAYAALRVSDSGPGIAADDLERIFEPFFSRKTLGRSGTGLGLAVVWNTVREHRGFVDVASGDGGTVFSVYLPASSEALEPRSTPPEDLEQLQSSGMVLVVDDERHPREIAARMLKALGYDAVTVSSGEEALEYLKTRAVDIVLIDMIMDPGMSGFETYRKILAIRPGQRAVMTSGYAEHRDLAKAVELGARGFLRKPFTTAQLAAAIRKAAKGLA